MSQGSDRGYFNSTLGSLATLSGILSLKKHILFSFRTCLHGVIVSQTAANQDKLEFLLTEGGSLRVSWSHDGSVGFIDVGDDTLSDNRWYTVESTFLLGEIYLKIEQGQDELFKMLLSNSTYNNFLWTLDVSGRSVIEVGSGFTGCIIEGFTVTFSTNLTSSNNVQWGQCPSAQACGMYFLFTKLY